MTHSCVLDLPGSLNLRDFGGHATADGRMVRKGRLLRSGLLTGLTPAAVAALQGMDVRAVCDLRRNEERRLHPNPGMGEQCRAYQWESALENSPMRERSFAESANLEAARSAMVTMYERLPYNLQPRLAGAFAAIAHAGEGATIIHCSAGKDRTGVAVALVLSALGVPRETIVDDYLYTNIAVDFEARLVEHRAEGLGLSADASPLLALQQHARRALLEAHPSYLAASFASIESRHGSVERYLADELGVGPEMQDALRRALLVS